MTNLLNRLAFALPSVRRLVNENTRLRLDAEVRVALKAAEIVDKKPAKGGGDLWVPTGHFYSPLVDPTDSAVQRSIDLENHPVAKPESFGISEDEMLRWFNTIAEQYATQPFPERFTPGSRYYYSNPNFPLADALALLAFMVTRRPKRFVEIGAGFSSCAAIDINERYLNGEVEMTFIEPHPELALDLIGPDPRYRDRLLISRLQDVSLEIFQALGKDDILFIDSSHIGKTGSDVLDYMFRVFPCLNPNVMVHIHDIFYPFEYPGAWIVDENRSWNEAYLLRAFLQGNRSFQVLYFSDWFFKCRRPLVQSRMPLCISNRGGSIWLEKQGPNA